MPGFLLGGLYIVYIIIRTRLHPEQAPLPEGGGDVTFADKLKSLPRLIPPLLVVFVVLGSIYGGITGITEAAGMGTVAVLVIILLRREISWLLFREALMRTFKSTGTIMWVTFGATALAGAYSIAGGPTYVANLIVGAEMPTCVVLLVMMLIFLFLGAIMDWVGIVLLVMPVFLPIVKALPVEELGPGRHDARGERGVDLVRHPVLRQHAGELPQPAVRPGRLLPQVGGAARTSRCPTSSAASCRSSASSCWCWRSCCYGPASRCSSTADAAPAHQRGSWLIT